jgi:hypothetical protein
MSLFTNETLGWLCVVPGAMPLVVARPNCFSFYVASISQKSRDETNNSSFELAFKKLEI